MPNIIDKIIEYKQQAIIESKRKISQQSYYNQAKNSDSTKDLFNNLKTKVLSKELAIIPEIKKFEPRKGLIRKSFSPTTLATIYEKAGSTAISVVTEESAFKGSIEHLRQVKEKTHLPILRKDYLIDPYQIIESKIIGADAIVLMMSILSIEQALELEALALDLELDVVIEIHNVFQYKMAQKLKSQLICINNRDLRTLEVDLENIEKLVKIIEPGKIIICENGIQSIEDIKFIQQYGIYSCILGECLLNRPNLSNAIKILLK